MRLGLVYIFYTFLLVVAGLSYFSSPGQHSQQRNINEKDAKRVSIFGNSFVGSFKPNSKNVNIFSEKLIDDPNSNEIYLLKPNGVVGDFNKLEFQGDEGRVVKATNVLLLKKNIFIQKNGARIWSDQMQLDYVKNNITAEENVRSIFVHEGREVKVASARFDASEAKQEVRYIGSVVGDITENGQKSEDIHFKSDLLIFNDHLKTMSLRGNTYLRRGKSEINSIFGNIWLDSLSKGVKYFSMNDDVEMQDEYTNSNGKLVKRFSFSEKLEGFSKDNMIILSGFPQVKQEGDIIKGNEMIIREDQEVIEIINTNSQFEFNKEDN